MKTKTSKKTKKNLSIGPVAAMMDPETAADLAAERRQAEAEHRVEKALEESLKAVATKKRLTVQVVPAATVDPVAVAMKAEAQTVAQAETARKATRKAESSKRSGIATAATVEWLRGLLPDVKEQSSFFQFKGKGGGKVYVAKSADLSRIDVSGLQDLQVEGLKPFVYGAVRYQVVVDGRTEEQVRGTLAALAALLDSTDLKERGLLLVKEKKTGKTVVVATA